MRRHWYVDSSVALRALVERSIAAGDWVDGTAAAGEVVVSSRLLELELWRTARREHLDQTEIREWLDLVFLTAVDNRLLTEAAAIQPNLNAADAIHLAAALRIGVETITVATHDAQMAAAARSLGFTVHDPVTDDPGRGPVA